MLIWAYPKKQRRDKNMADEIAQVIQIEMQGMTMAIKGTVQMAEWFMMAMKALMEYRGERKEEKMERKEKRQEQRLEKAGEKSKIADIIELSKDGVPQVVEVPEKHLQRFLELSTRNGARFCQLVDFDATDGNKPVFFPPQDLIIANKIIQSLNEEDRIKLGKDRDGIEEKIAELTEKLLHAKGSKKAELEKEIDILDESLDELKEVIDTNSRIAEKGTVVSFQEYLSQAKGTEFEIDPDKAISELEKGVEIGKKFPLTDCLQPARNASYIKISGDKTHLYYYIPISNSVIERVIWCDLEKNQISSNYRIITNSGEKYEFFDRDITKAEWNEKILPQILEKAGAIEGTSCRVFNSEEKLNAYLKHHNQVKPKSEENIEKLREEGKEVFSSADAKAEIEYALSQDLKAMASATWDKDKVEFAFPEDKVTRSNGKLRAELEDGSAILFNGVQAEGVENGKCYFSVKQEDEVFLEKKSDDVNARPLIKTSVADIKESMKKQEQANAAQQKDRIRGAGR